MIDHSTKSGAGEVSDGIPAAPTTTPGQKGSRWEPVYHSVSPTAVVLIGVTAALVLVGWQLGNEYLKRIFPAMVAMNPLTAVGFLSASGALWLSLGGRPSRPRALTRGVLTAVVAVAGLSKLSDLFLDTPFHFDQFLFADRLTGDGLVLNRMAPNTAVCFALSGISLWLLNTGRLAQLTAAQTLAVTVILLSLLAVVGYAYGIAGFYGVNSFIPMALHTATSFLFLSIGILFARPRQGLMTIVTSDTAGGLIARLMLPAAVLIPIAVGWLPLAGQRAGLFTLEVGVALFVMTNVLILIALIWWNARLLYASDLKRTAAETQLLYSASHDALTGLANRAQFLDELVRAIVRAQRSHTQLAVLYLDLDGFKQVNDVLGHPAGDRLLKQVAERMLRSAREVDLSARLGGDEFTVLSESVSPASAQGLAERMLKEISQPYDLDGKTARIGVSVGIALSGPDTADAEELLQRADAALYTAKRGGKGRICSLPPPAAGHTADPSSFRSSGDAAAIP